MRFSPAYATLLLALLGGCEADGAWEAFGNPAELEVEVGVPDVLPAVEAFAGGQVADDLPVANIRLEPGGGPVGTEHSLRVAVEEDFEEDVQRVTVRVDANKYGTIAPMQVRPPQYGAMQRCVPALQQHSLLWVHCCRLGGRNAKCS